MYARVTPFQMKTDRIDDAVQIADQEIIPALRDVPGYKEIRVLADRQTGVSMVITFWDSQADEEASREQVGQRFSSLVDILMGPPGSSSDYEVVQSDPKV